VQLQSLLPTFEAFLQLLGTLGWLFLGFGFVAAFFLSRFSPFSVEVQHRLLLWLPGFLLLACMFTRCLHGRSTSLFDWYFYPFHDANLDAAFIVSFAFGCAFTLDLLRARERRSRVVGWSFVPLYLGLLAVILRQIHGWYAAYG